MKCAKLIRFYGLSPTELDQLSTYDVEKLNRAISVIEAQEILVKLSVGDYPNMKKEDRRNYHKRIYKMAYPFSEDDSFVTAEELARTLNGRTN